jgi:hypothetical protein
MGGKKLRLSVQRKNHKKALRIRVETGLKLSIPVKLIVNLPALSVSLPITSYFDAPVTDVNTLRARIEQSSPLPSSWVITTESPWVVLCKLKTVEVVPPKISVFATITVNDKLEWSMSFAQPKLDPRNSCCVDGLPTAICSLSDLLAVLSCIDSSKVCVGNPDVDILQMWQRRSLTLHGFNGIFIIITKHIITVVCM